MIAVPADTPVTMPLNEPMEMVADALLHIPPLAVSVSVSVVPVHINPVPVTTVGELLTVTVVVALHPVGAVKVIALVPVVIPVTIPVPDPIVSTPVLPLIHAPAPLSVRLMWAPIHTADGPPITAGFGFTVTVAVR